MKRKEKWKIASALFLVLLLFISTVFAVNAINHNQIYELNYEEPFTFVPIACPEGIEFDWFFDDDDFSQFEEANNEMIELGEMYLGMRSFTFGMLNTVTRLLQSDSRWGGNALNNCAGTTISSHGCALTSIAMIYQYFGGTRTPGALNTDLGGLACPMAWATVGSRLNMPMVGGANANTAAHIHNIHPMTVGAIAMGRPVIIGLLRNGGSHFVVAYGFSGNTIFIHDPANTTHRTLEDHVNAGWQIVSIRVFAGIPLRPPSLFPACDPFGNCIEVRSDEEPTVSDLILQKLYELFAYEQHNTH